MKLKEFTAILEGVLQERRERLEQSQPLRVMPRFDTLTKGNATFVMGPCPVASEQTMRGFVLQSVDALWRTVALTVMESDLSAAEKERVLSRFAEEARETMIDCKRQGDDEGKFDFRGQKDAYLHCVSLLEKIL